MELTTYLRGFVAHEGRDVNGVVVVQVGRNEWNGQSSSVKLMIHRKRSQRRSEKEGKREQLIIVNDYRLGQSVGSSGNLIFIVLI